MPKIGAVILAAGRSRRFGSDKRSHRLADGRAMLAATVARYQQVFEALRIVIRGDEHELPREWDIQLRHSDKVISARNSELGMGHSLAAGISGVSWHGAVVALADMPDVQEQTLHHLRATLLDCSEPCIVRPAFRDGARARDGQPVGFTHHYYPTLAQLEGDQGARQLIREHNDNVMRVEVDDPGVVQDYDRPEDLPVA